MLTMKIQIKEAKAKKPSAIAKGFMIANTKITNLIFQNQTL